jgi:hypothetical protein
LILRALVGPGTEWVTTVGLRTIMGKKPSGVQDNGPWVEWHEGNAESLPFSGLMTC